MLRALGAVASLPALCRMSWTSPVGRALSTSDIDDFTDFESLGELTGSPLERQKRCTWEITGWLKDNNLQKALKWRKRMEMGEGIAPNVVTYTAFLNWYLRTDRMEEASEVLMEMRSSGIEPSPQTMNVMAVRLMEKGNLNEAEQKIQELMASGRADQYTYSSLLQGRLVRQDIEGAKTMLRSMGAEGVQPTVVQYSLVISSLIKANKFDEAVALYEEMKSAGIQADLFVYSQLINGHARAGRFEAALALIAELKSAGLRPNVVVYSALINELLRSSKVDEAKALLHTMRLDGIMPDIVLYNTFIRTYLQKNNVEEVLAVLKTIEQQLVHVNSSLVNMCIEWLLNNKLTAEANTLLGVTTREIKQFETTNELCLLLCKLARKAVKAYRLRADVHTWAIFMRRALRAGDFDEVRRLGERARATKTPFSAFVYNLLIECELKSKNPNAAQALCDEMLQKSIHPDEYFKNQIRPALIRHARSKKPQ